jgi:HSP20 family molecular chaperone IbpA
VSDAKKQKLKQRRKFMISLVPYRSCGITNGRSSLAPTVEGLLDSFLNPVTTGPWRYRVTAEGYEFALDLPGTRKENVHLQVENGVLILDAERRIWTDVDDESNLRKAHYTLELPENADAERVSASLSDGVMTIAVPKKESARPKTVEIHVK